MPRTSKTAADESNDSHLPTAVENAAGTIILSPNPVLIVGVNRRASLGGYEHLDIYAGITLPINASPEDIEGFSEAAKEAANQGFAIVSKETFERYNLIKNPPVAAPAE